MWQKNPFLQLFSLLFICGWLLWIEHEDCPLKKCGPQVKSITVASHMKTEKKRKKELKEFVPRRSVFLVGWHYGCKNHYNETLFLLGKNYMSPQVVRVRLYPETHLTTIIVTAASSERVKAKLHSSRYWIPGATVWTHTTVGLSKNRYLQHFQYNLSYIIYFCVYLTTCFFMLIS